MKGFVRLIEVSLAFVVIFIVLNNIQTYVPPRYEDVNNMQRLSRYAEDVAFSICGNEQFRGVLVDGIIPINSSIRADAWNKSEESTAAGWMVSNNIEATIRQVTQMNKSCGTIRVCLNTSGPTEGANFSICERSAGTNCTAGTLSSDETLPAGTNDLVCSDWFEYDMTEDKDYLVNVHFSDFDYYNYYERLGITNGFYFKESADETQNENVTGYDDYTNEDALEMRIDALYDAGLNETLPDDIDYHIWLYSNESADWKLDDLINETENVPNESFTSTLSSLINTTAQFDAGTKSDPSDGNYDVETNSDNPFVQENTLMLGSKHGDSFSYDDADGITWKWAEDSIDSWGYWGTQGNVTAVVENGKYNFMMENGTSETYPIITKAFNETFDGDFDAQVKVYFPNVTDANSIEASLVITNEENPAFPNCYLYPYYNGAWALAYYCSDDANTQILSGEISMSPEGNLSLGLRAERIGTVCNLYYDEGLTGEYTLIDSTYGSGDCFSGETKVILEGYDSWQNNDLVTIAFDDFKAESNDAVEFRSESNWTSAEINASAGALESTTINFYSPTNETCIDSIKWLVNGESKAAYDTDVCNYTTAGRSETQESAENNGMDYSTGTFTLPASNAVDNDWNTYSSSTGGYIYMSYKVPAGATNNSVWRVKDGLSTGYDDISLSQACFNGTELNLMIKDGREYADGIWTPYIRWNCWNGTDWDTQKNSIFANNVYEEEMIWDISESTITITEDNLTNGTFADVNESFAIKTALKSDGTNSPTIKSASWNYDETGTQTRITGIATASCLISGYNDIYSPKKIVVGIWNKAN